MHEDDKLAGAIAEDGQVHRHAAAHETAHQGPFSDHPHVPLARDPQLISMLTVMKSDVKAAQTTPFPITLSKIWGCARVGLLIV